MPNLARLPLAARAAVLILLIARPADAAGLLDPAAAKLAAGCQQAIAKAGASFAAATSKSLDKCYDGIFDCVQLKPAEPACIAKALAKCTAEVDTKAPQSRLKLAAAIAKKCASFADLTSADGLGYGDLASECLTDFGTTLTDVASVAECVRAQHECRAELAFGVAMPRAGQLAADVPVPTRAGSCLVNRGGNGLGGVGDPKGVGKALAGCQKALKQVGAKLAAAKLKSLGKCVATAVGCAQTKPGDAKCAAKAQAACDKAVGVEIPKAEANAAAAIGKKCLPAFPFVGSVSALNVDALASACQIVGVASLATVDDLATCVLRQQTCSVEEQLRFAAPRAAALLQGTGHTLASAFCGPAPIPTPTISAEPTVSPSPTPSTDFFLTATPTPSVDPSVTPTPTPSAPPTTTPTATFTPAPGEVLLSVTKLGGGTGTVTFGPLGSECGATCAVSVAPGTTITLQARTQNGADAYFQGFTGGGCVGAERDCVIQVNADTHVDATFAAQDFNLVFLTSATYATDLGGVFNYDVECNNAASAAGINDTDLNGTRFVAWLSDSSSTAATRIGGTARGFVRLDGKPVADTMAGLLAGAIMNPISIDETGTEVPNSAVMTGTLPDGTALTTANCSDWFSNSGLARAGRSSAGPQTWTSFTNSACDPARLYCFMRTKTAALPTTPVAGKLAFVTNAPYVPGSGDPDARCEADKPSGTGPVEALLARTTATAASHLDSAAVYVRPDGQVIGTGQQLIDTAAVSDRLESGFWQSGDGAYADATPWAGATNLTTLPAASDTCDDWSVTTGSGRAGRASFTTQAYWTFGSLPCNSAFVRLLCVEQ